jgi:hypothetical protein
MGAVGSSTDNAVAEAWFAALKRELPYGPRWATPQRARLDVFAWISFYNNKRRHSALGYLCPAAYENRQPSTTMLAWPHEIRCPPSWVSLRFMPGWMPNRAKSCSAAACSAWIHRCGWMLSADLIGVILLVDGCGCIAACWFWRPAPDEIVGG